MNTATKFMKVRKPIFPVDRATKEPAVKWKVYQNRPPSKAVIRTWQRKKPGANMGMSTGHLSGVVVVDCDSEESVNRFIQSYPEAQSTRQVATGRGRHFYFQHCDGIRNDAGKLLGAGIDIRGEGGFVVVPPSIHANGKPYEYINRNRPIALPEQLKQVLAGHSTDRDPTGSNAVLVEQPIKDGQRNNTLASMAGAMRHWGMSEEAIQAALLIVNSQKCEPPLPGTEVEGIAKSVARYPATKLIAHPREETVRKEIKLQTWEEFLSTTPEEREYTINGILPDSGLAVLLGRGKQGKSTLATHACRAVATGQSFLEQQTKEKPVVYVNYEMGEDYLQILLRAGDCPREAYIINRPEPILTLKTIEYIMGQVENAPGMMVIDSFRGAFKLQGDAENLSGGAGVLLRQLQDLAINKGWLIILIHHSNRGSREGTDSVSGTGDWIAAPDVLWSWSRPDPNKSGTLTIEGRIPPVEPMAVKSTPEECRYVGTVKEDKDQTDREEILEALTDEGQTADVIAGATGKPPGTVRKRLDTLYKEGRVDREGAGKKNDAFRWVKIHSAQGNPLGAETNNGDNQAEEGGQCQTFNL